MNYNKIVIVDYGLGNIQSVVRAVEKSGARNVLVSSSIEEVESADKIILPGVGAFADGMQGLQRLNLVNSIRRHSEQSKPLLGICLGMQLLATSSDEFGNYLGLDIIPGKVIPIPPEGPDNSGRKIPFIGWSTVASSNQNYHNALVESLCEEKQSFYFVHSFYFSLHDASNLVASYDCNGINIPAAIRSKETYGFQFHPEKSGVPGLRLLKMFVDL
jgi:glutamine amidotransferase